MPEHQLFIDLSPDTLEQANNLATQIQDWMEAHDEIVFAAIDVERNKDRLVIRAGAEFPDYSVWKHKISFMDQALLINPIFNMLIVHFQKHLDKEHKAHGPYYHSAVYGE